MNEQDFQEHLDRILTIELNEQVRKSLPAGWSAKRIDLPGVPPTYEVRNSLGEFIGVSQIDSQFPLETHALYWQERAREEGL